MYELTDTVHPGGGDTFKKLCAGNGRTKGTPLKTVNWAGITGAHPYVSVLACVGCPEGNIACDRSTQVLHGMICVGTRNGVGHCVI